MNQTYKITRHNQTNMEKKKRNIAKIYLNKTKMV